MLEASGAMKTIRVWLNGISNNQVAQLMIIGWAFSFMIEGASGFGTPAALAAPILVSLGFPAFKAAIFCLVMNSVPVSFGAVGTPTWYGFGTILETMDAAARNEFILAIGYKSVLFHSAASLVIPLSGLVVVVGWKKVRANLLFFLRLRHSVQPDIRRHSVFNCQKSWT
jgi:lactate permease